MLHSLCMCSLVASGAQPCQLITSRQVTLSNLGTRCYSRTPAFSMHCSQRPIPPSETLKRYVFLSTLLIPACMAAGTWAVYPEPSPCFSYLPMPLGLDASPSAKDLVVHRGETGTRDPACRNLCPASDHRIPMFLMACILIGDAVWRTLCALAFERATRSNSSASERSEILSAGISTSHGCSRGWLATVHTLHVRWRLQRAS